MAPIHSVHVVDFHLTKGAYISCSFPAIHSTSLSSFITEHAMPEGAHKRTEDFSLLILKPKTSEPDDCLYGISLSVSTLHPSVPRGALQKAVVIILNLPIVLQLKPLLRAMHSHVIQLALSDSPIYESELSLLSEVHSRLTTVLSSNSILLSLWDQRFLIHSPPAMASLHIPPAATLPLISSEEHLADSAIARLGLSWDVDPFPGVSLVRLVQLFRSGVMVIWRAMVSGSRVLFHAGSGEEVGECCLAAPYLILPLMYAVENITPYVSLAMSEPLAAPSFLCGVTNPILSERDCYDVTANIETGKVSSNTVKSSLRDKAFIKKLVYSLDKSELKGEEREVWLRNEFSTHNELFLARVTTEFGKNSFTHYLEKRECQLHGRVAMKSVHQLSTDVYSSHELVAIYRDLDASLTSSAVRSMIGEAGGVRTVLQGLTQSEPEIRQSALNILAKLCFDSAAEEEILAPGTFSLILACLDDWSPDVVESAAYFIRLLSCTQRGATELYSSSSSAAFDRLGGILMAQEYSEDTKLHSAMALQQVLQFFPDLGVPDSLRYCSDARYLKTQSDYFPVFLELIDSWQLELPLYNPSVPVHEFLIALRGKSSPSMSTAAARFCKSLEANRYLGIEFVMQDGFEKLLQLNGLLDPVLSQSLWRILIRASASKIGAMRILRLGLIPKAFEYLVGFEEPTISSIYTALFLEYATHNSLLVERIFAESKGFTRFVKFIKRTRLKHKNMIVMTLPILRAIQQTFTVFPEYRREISEACIPLVELLSDDLNNASEDELAFELVCLSVTVTVGLREESQLLETLAAHPVPYRDEQFLGSELDEAPGVLGGYLELHDDNHPEEKTVWVVLEDSVLYIWRNRNKRKLLDQIGLEYIVFKPNSEALEMHVLTIERSIVLKSEDWNFRKWCDAFRKSQESALESCSLIMTGWLSYRHDSGVSQIVWVVLDEDTLTVYESETCASALLQLAVSEISIEESEQGFVIVNDTNQKYCMNNSKEIGLWRNSISSAIENAHDTSSVSTEPEQPSDFISSLSSMFKKKKKDIEEFLGESVREPKSPNPEVMLRTLLRSKELRRVATAQSPRQFALPSVL